MKKILLLSLIFLAGCATTELVSSNQNTVIVKAELQKPEEAQRIADKECVKGGKMAKLNQFVPANVVWANYFFDCK